MSDRLRQVFDKHSDKTNVERWNDVKYEWHHLGEKDLMTFDQFEAAVKEIVMSDSEIEKWADETIKKVTNTSIDYEHGAYWGLVLGIKHLRSHILGTYKKENN